MDHNFFLIRQQELPGEELHSYQAILQHQQAHVCIHDSVMHDINRFSLRWIELFNPGRREPHMGLCCYGRTIIRWNRAPLFGSVLANWAELLSIGPPSIEWSVGWFPPETFVESHGEQHVETHDRDKLLDRLTTLQDLCREVSISDGSLYLSHFGL